jgi:hypothetical protein
VQPTVKGPTIKRIEAWQRVDVAMQTIERRAGIGRSAAWGGGLALLWLVLALARPSLTFHLAPLLVAAAPPVLLTLDDRAGATRREIVLATVLGAAMALVTTGILTGLGRLEGPGLGPFPDALVESLAFVAIGALIGVSGGCWRLRRVDSASS